MIFSLARTARSISREDVTLRVVVAYDTGKGETGVVEVTTSDYAPDFMDAPFSKLKFENEVAGNLAAQQGFDKDALTVEVRSVTSERAHYTKADDDGTAAGAADLDAIDIETPPVSDEPAADALTEDAPATQLRVTVSFARGDETGECEVETAEFPARFAEVGALRDAFLESTKQKIAEEQGWELASLELEIRAIERLTWEGFRALEVHYRRGDEHASAEVSLDNYHPSEHEETVADLVKLLAEESGWPADEIEITAVREAGAAPPPAPKQRGVFDCFEDENDAGDDFTWQQQQQQPPSESTPKRGCVVC